MAHCFKQNINYIIELCRRAWERAGRKFGAFLRNVVVDYRDGSIWYDCERERVKLVGWKIKKVWNHATSKSEWGLVGMEIF